MITDFFLSISSSFSATLINILPSTTFGFDWMFLDDWVDFFVVNLNNWNFLIPVKMCFLFGLAIVGCEFSLIVFKFLKMIYNMIRGAGA